MQKRFRKAAIATLVAMGASTILGVFGAGAAQASEESGAIDGIGKTTNDWSDEGTLQKDDESNAVALWQTILVADGAFFKDSTGALRPFTENDISGEFDKRTKSATKDWQKDRDLEQTGKANGASFSLADDNLSAVNKKGNVTYEGTIDDVTFKRKTVAGFDEQVYFVNFDGSFVPATY